jgi:hypothetical protein
MKSNCIYLITSGLIRTKFSFDSVSVDSFGESANSREKISVSMQKKTSTSRLGIKIPQLTQLE